MSSKSFGKKKPVLPHLVQGEGGLAGEVADLRRDVEEGFQAVETPGHGGSGAIAVEEWLAPAGAGILYWVGATAFTSAAQSVASASAQLPEPRNLVLDFVIAAGVVPVPCLVVVHGLDIDGAARSVSVQVPAATGTVDAKVPLKKVTSVDIPADGGAVFAGTVSVGFGDAIGLGSEVKTRHMGAHVIEEIMDGVLISPSTGAFDTKVSAPPYGSYTPAAVPNGVHNYLLTYERA